MSVRHSLRCSVSFVERIMRTGPKPNIHVTNRQVTFHYTVIVD
jgi:hypothetical protein